MIQLILIPFTWHAQAQSGQLDPTFDGDGIAIFSPEDLNFGRDLVTLPDMSTVVCGTAGDYNFVFNSFVMRVLPDGSQDMAFGSGGLTNPALVGADPDEKLAVNYDELGLRAAGKVVGRAVKLAKKLGEH